MLAVQGDELAAYALELGEGHWCRGQLNELVDILHSDLAPSFSCMVFLVCHDLREYVGCCLVELIQVILLCGRFLAM